MTEELHPGTAVCLHIPTLPEYRHGTVIAELPHPKGLEHGPLYRVLVAGLPSWRIVHHTHLERDAELAQAVFGFVMP